MCRWSSNKPSQFFEFLKPLLNLFFAVSECIILLKETTSHRIPCQSMTKNFYMVLLCSARMLLSGLAMHIVQFNWKWANHARVDDRRLAGSCSAAVRRLKHAVKMTAGILGLVVHQGEAAASREDNLSNETRSLVDLAVWLTRSAKQSRLHKNWVKSAHKKQVYHDHWMHGNNEHLRQQVKGLPITSCVQTVSGEIGWVLKVLTEYWYWQLCTVLMSLLLSVVSLITTLPSGLLLVSSCFLDPFCIGVG